MPFCSQVSEYKIESIKIWGNSLYAIFLYCLFILALSEKPAVKNYSSNVWGQGIYNFDPIDVSNTYRVKYRYDAINAVEGLFFFFGVSSSSSSSSSPSNGTKSLSFSRSSSVANGSISFSASSSSSRYWTSRNSSISFGFLSILFVR